MTVYRLILLWLALQITSLGWAQPYKEWIFLEQNLSQEGRAAQASGSLKQTYFVFGVEDSDSFLGGERKPLSPIKDTIKKLKDGVEGYHFVQVDDYMNMLRFNELSKMGQTKERFKQLLGNRARVNQGIKRSLV